MFTRHRSLSLVCLFFFLSLALAGCVGTEGNQDTGEDSMERADDDEPTMAPETGQEEAEVEPEGEEPASYPYGLESCQWVVPFIPAQADAVAEHLPEGFEPFPYGGFPQQPGQDATIGIEVFRCERGTTELDSTIEPATVAQYWTFVEPPADLEFPEADAVFYFWDRLVPDDASRDFLASAGLPVHDGSVEVDVFETTPSGHMMHASVQLGGESASISGTALDPSPGGFTYVGITETPQGFAFREVRINLSEGGSGTGVVDLSAGSLFAEMLGTTRTDAYIVAGPGGSHMDGKVTLPG